MKCYVDDASNVLLTIFLLRKQRESEQLLITVCLTLLTVSVFNLSSLVYTLGEGSKIIALNLSKGI